MKRLGRGFLSYEIVNNNKQEEEEEEEEERKDKGVLLSYCVFALLRTSLLQNFGGIVGGAITIVVWI